MNEPKPRSVDDIAREIEEIAFNGEGTDKLRALKMLREDRGGAAITLPEPRTHQEKVSRLCRIMKAFGADLCRIAFAEAFPRTVDNLGDVAPKITEEDLTEEEETLCRRMRSLKMLYKQWPKLKRPGILPGYPVRGGEEAQTAWCQNEARKIIRDQKQSKANAASFLERLKDDGQVHVG